MCYGNVTDLSRVSVMCDRLKYSVGYVLGYCERNWSSVYCQADGNLLRRILILNSTAYIFSVINSITIKLSVPNFICHVSYCTICCILGDPPAISA